MNKRLMRTIAAVTSAGAAVVGLGMMGGAAAAAPVPTATVPAYYSTSFAGYQTGGYNMRFVAATVTVPAAAKETAGTDVAQISLFRGDEYLAQIAVMPGGGKGTVQFLDKGFAAGKFNLVPKVGDELGISIYRDQRTGRDQFVVTDLRIKTGKVISVERLVQTPKALVPRHASLGCGIDNGQVITPAQDMRLWLFKDAALTTYNGVKGAVFGPWTTHQILDTVTGTPAGAIVMHPSYPWNNAHNFGLWLNGK